MTLGPQFEQLRTLDEMDMADLNKPDTRIPDHFVEIGKRNIQKIKDEHGWE